MTTPKSTVIPFVRGGSRRQGVPQPSVEDLLARYNAGLRRYLFRWLSAPEDVEDVVQEVYCRALQRGGLDALENPGAFLYRTAHNILVDRYRRHRLEQGLQDEERQAALEGQDSGKENNFLQYAEMTLAYQQALAELPKKCRQVFLMRRHDGLSTAEIARAMNISMRMVQKQMIKAMNHFYNRLC